ncbi:GntG family PLP-dependent aldolase [Propionivibrio dicarboxylicus]|uniref:L-threonine aldolase n=1 Tax=Propionivibrio dicarboxylicus TaxID=83767 RepID=A0A1G7Z3M8_9RHOO|nr:GntG family PLP-dependent aldolase [Propionivibrio dicarboxylicus]SDH03274.1 L-threonine aldolase [Propionivibrio dicarboxylicus]
MNQIEHMRHIRAMLDLRSDTSTLPTPEMWKAMSEAEVGDGGRVDLTGRGEDPTVMELEALAAKMTGKDDSIFMPTGSLANHVALYATAKHGDHVLVEEKSHIYINEKFDFLPEFGNKIPVTYHLTPDFQIDLSEIKRLLDCNEVKVLCIENTHNYSSGTCLTPETTANVCELAHRYGVHVHLDGARVFNAAIALGCDVKELTQPVDSLMFCISKGLCAPVGSLLCGNTEFIRKAQIVRKIVGTLMRQAGVVAAAGIVALKENIDRLATDHANASYLGELLGSISNVTFDKKADQSNFVYLNVTPTGLNAQEVTNALRKRGLLVSKMTDDSIRFATHRDVSKQDVERAAEITKAYFSELKFNQCDFT